MSSDRPCVICDKPRPSGRTKYCSDDCAAMSGARVRRRTNDHKLAACSRCGGEKERGVRGGKYCSSCRQVVADASAQFIYEQRRRKKISEFEAKLANGERVRKRTGSAPDGHKWCARCQSFRPLSSFAARVADRKQASYCIPCQRSYNRERHVRLNFGLDWDEYEMLMACQDFRCAICGGRPRKHALSVDHDHVTGEIRGLLCSRCNHRLLGSANDSPERLRRAADYLEAYAPRDVFGTAKHVPGFGPSAAGYGDPASARPSDLRSETYE